MPGVTLKWAIASQRQQTENVGSGRRKQQQQQQLAAVREKESDTESTPKLAPDLGG